MVDVLMRGFDVANSMTQTAETVLTSAAVRQKGLARKFIHVLPGDTRGTESSPLIKTKVPTKLRGLMDLAIYSTQSNLVCAFDAYGPEMIWSVQLGDPVTVTRALDEYLLNDHAGIYSTGVIDPIHNRWIGCTWISTDGTVATAQHFVAAVDLTDGSLAHPLVPLEGLTYTAPGGVEQTFASAVRKQRASLLQMPSGEIYIPFGSVSETARTSRGWIAVFDPDQERITAIWCSIGSPEGFGAGIWSAGGKMCGDPQGCVYTMTSNGTWDGVRDWAQSFLQLKYTAPGSTAAMGSLEVTSWWTPWTDDGRSGLDRSGDEFGIPRATNYRAFAAANGAGWTDQDLGSGSPSITPNGILIGAGKDDVIFSVNSQNMGQTNPGDLANPAANYAKLAAPPILGYFAPWVNPTPDNIADLNMYAYNITHHQHGEMVNWPRFAGFRLFSWCENENLRAWSISPAGKIGFEAIGAEVASVECSRVGGNHGGMPGGMISLSCNGIVPETGVVWADIPYGDANMAIVMGRLLAYDAETFGKYSDGTGSIPPIWDSEKVGATFVFNKFNRPVVANGFLYNPTFSGTVEVWSLAA